VVSASSSAIRGGVTAEREVGVDADLQRLQAQLLQSRDVGRGEGVEGEVRQRRAAPQRERLPEHRRRGIELAIGKRFAGAIEEPLERAHVDVLGIHA